MGGDSFVGLFGYIDAGSTLRYVGLLNSSMNGANDVGALAGYNAGAISYSYADGGTVNGSNNSVGGLVGSSPGTIDYSYANVRVTGGNTGAGGLKGTGSGNVSNSYATGSVMGFFNVGGLVGQQGAPGTISNCYSTGAVDGLPTGGLVGGLTGGAGGAGGGAVNANVVNSYWDTQTSRVASSLGGTGLTTAQMQSMASFSGWSIANSGGSTAVWRIYEGATYPLLKSFLTPLTVTANSTGKTYDGLAYSGSNGASYSVAGAGTSPNLLGSLSYGGTSQGAVNAGSYTITASGYWSNQRGYDISYVDGALTVNPASLTVTANNAGKTYDGLAWSGSNGVAYTGFVNGETSSVLGGTLAYGGTSQGAVNAGTYAITPSGLTSGNYTITYAGGILNIDNATPSQTVQNAVSQAQATVLPPQASTPHEASAQPHTMDPSPTITDVSAGGVVMANTMWNVAGTGPTLQVVNGGMKLPANTTIGNDSKGPL
ncbi:hypothetical protein FGKAn22_16720 [Ferrigenium kumadai]|uniref:MBG domain-containing protein n=1 Tax=Ferrigenium kumadai TaxID=1682490 RepID=A0AAN1W008_9PROT|nr:MBG domain-containing protein [Ferrigenium kumadai]BBI99979.1 hypothetical protein FGKAn22_16720 [Ferrigenium kumadai]